MNDTAIKNFCIWARNELRQQVAQQALLYGITEEGYGDANAEIIEGRVLTSEEKRERINLIKAYLGKVDEGYPGRYSALIERAAYTWFNRFAAIRFMEVNGRLFSRVRMFSDPEGNFAPQVLKEALEVQIEGVDRAKVADLLDAGDDEALFRYLFLAQCNELAACMPEVFDPIGSALELLLPQNLLRNGSVIERMIADIPEEDWQEGVQIVGWMYQYYNAELKDEVFASFKKGKKADAAALAPATQLFTPDWIVQYLVENSLGRIWMRSHPDSDLVDQMPYYIPDSDEVVISVDSTLSPEAITLVDPACGSGHILVYAFELLGCIYEEAGYTRRDIPQLVLKKNLSGIEIDPRAAQWAAFALHMAACEYDTRFLRRGVQPQITTLEPVTFEEEELALLPGLADRTKFLDAMEHMNECGSLFVPDKADLAAIDDALESLRISNNLFANSAREKLEQMKKNCQPLARTYDVVVANPPYMGSKNMAKWLSDWTKKNYPDEKGDLCTCFIERGFALAIAGGYSAMITMHSWMFLNSFERLRKKLLENSTLISMLHTQGPNNHSDVFDANAAMVIEHAVQPGYIGSYFKLDKLGLSVKEKMLKEAIANPDCGWFYRRDGSSFSAIPGTPIAYWASEAMIRAFKMQTLSKYCESGGRTKTHNNELFIRCWWEVNRSSIITVWLPYANGGGFSRWSGLDLEVVNWSKNARDWYSAHGGLPKAGFNEADAVCWGLITSDRTSFRLKKHGYGFSSGSPTVKVIKEFNNELILALLNSSVANTLIGQLNPTLATNVSDVLSMPICSSYPAKKITTISKECISQVDSNWNAFEISREFKSHPMV